ncbi:hypothetical protein AB0F09_18610 [Streptomyces olivaceus]|uniref:hypothetical protein n=1 Tax=Streptomyces olivaceus TaxID=47716 RepID=UPI0033DD2BEF
MTEQTHEHTARLDQRTLTLADRLIESDADEVRSALAFIRETWDGRDGDDQTPAEAFRTLADYATEIAKLLDTYEEAEHIVRKKS